MKISLFAGVLPGLLAAFTAVAAENVAEYTARIWQSDEGLPIDSAWSATQTTDGYLWVGTQAGLARFDGVHFVVYNKKDIPGMTSANVTDVCATRDGGLWIATGAGGMHRFKDGRFTHYGPAEGLAGDDCLGAVFEDREGTVWVGTLEGLSRFKDGRFTTVNTNMVRGICEDHFHNLWMGTSSGIDCWSNGAIALHLGKTNGLYDVNVRAICCGRDGAIWASVGSEVKLIDHDSVKNFINREGPHENIVTALHEDRQGVLWVGTYSGLYRVVNGKLVPELNAVGLPYSAIIEFFEDREDNLWVSSKDGLIRLKPNRVLCYTQRQGLGSDNVSSVTGDRAGEICIATWGGGLNRLKNGVMTACTNNSPISALTLAQWEDRDGRFWVGTDFNNGLWELEGNHVRRFGGPDNTSLPAVRVILQDQAANLWVGTSRGLYKMHDFKLHLVGTNQGVDRDVIRALMEDHEGKIWIGAQTGLIREQNGIFTRFNSSNGFPRDFVLEVFEDRTHTIWAGTSGGGLVRCREGTFTSYTSRDGLFADSVSGILEDDNGWFWMASPRGIFRVSRKNLDDFDRGAAPSLHCISYGKSDGMMNKICSSVAKPSAWKDAKGRLWFATIKGLCMIDPAKKLLPEAPPPPIVIEELSTEEETLADPQNTGGPIVLQPGRGQLEFRFAALGFRAPEENRYQYKLEGVDRDWVNAGGRQTAHYNNIYPGHYTFRVIACNSDGVWNKPGAALLLVMTPHFWQRWWFRPALLALAVGAIAVLYKIILERRREIEQLRVRIAADLHDEIGSNLASIALLSQLGQKGPAPSPELPEINRIALITVGAIREIVWFINSGNDTMAEMVARMKEVAAQMLAGIPYTFAGPANPGGGKLSPDFRRNLFLIYKEILHNIVKHSHADEVEISLREVHGSLLLCVTDNGRGFDPAAVTRGNGVKNIRLRAGQLGGKVEIAPALAGGTIVTATVKIS